MRSQLAGIADEKTRRILITVFEYVLGNLSLGEPAHQERAKNFQQYFEQSTTASTGGQAFSFTHGLTHAPHLAIPVLDLQAVGSQFVPLTVNKVADGKRIYLTSASTNAPFALLIE